MRETQVIDRPVARLTSWGITAKLFQVVPKECLDSCETKMGQTRA